LGEIAAIVAGVGGGGGAIFYRIQHGNFGNRPSNHIPQMLTPKTPPPGSYTVKVDVRLEWQ
jgi:hypothetical protein